MKRLGLLGILLLSISCSGIAQNPYWNIGAGPYGGNVEILPTNGNLAYARHQEAYLFRSTDYGEHWMPFEIQPADTSVVPEALDVGLSGIFYSLISKQDDGATTYLIYRSLDEGATWELRYSSTNILKIKETHSGALIGADATGNFYRSTDGGLTWQSSGHVNINLTSGNGGFILGNNGIILLLVYNRPLFYSLDDGQSWNVGGDDIFNLSVRLNMMPSGTLFKMHSDGSGLFYRSTNWGILWEPCNIEFLSDEFAVSTVQLPGGRILLTTNANFYFSDDNGVSWDHMPTGAEKPSTIFFNSPLSNGVLIGFYNGAICRSSDNGATWAFSSYGIPMATTKQIAFLSDSIQLAVTSTGLWRSLDTGNTWSRLLIDTSKNIIGRTHLLAVLNADSFAINVGTKSWRTIDGGQNFLEITPPGTGAFPYLFVSKSGHLFTSDSSGTLVSPDFGLSWQQILPGEGLINLKQHPDGTLFAQTFPIGFQDEGHIRRSVGGDFNFEIISPAPQIFDWYGMAIDGYGELFLLGSNGQLFHSSDAGDTWSVTDIPGESPNQNTIGLNALGHIFISTGSYQIYVSVNQGQSWYTLPTVPLNLFIVHYLEFSPSGNLYVLPYSGYAFRSHQSTEEGGYIRGYVRRDADANCSTPDAQERIKNWAVEISGTAKFIATTSESGQYSAFVSPGEYMVSARIPQNLWWELCDSLQTVQMTPEQTIDSVDFVATAISECPLMTVDVAVPRLRRCFNNPIYVSYCNSGSEAADNAWVDVELDPYMSFVDSEQPHTPLGNNTYRFQLGNVDWGDCGQFSLTVHVDCDSTVLGQTHCISAHAFPDTLCNPVLNWSGATIEANATCQDSVVQLQLRNTTPVPSATLNYIIIEDDVVLFQGQRQYDGNEIFNLEYPANGHTWRVESQQEPGHPFSNVALAFLEGCGGFQTLGYVNQFSVNGWTPSVNQECVENTGSFDPNDKRGFPLGYGDAHRIRPGQALQYMIRFQNTGTDTAFTVQIRDTLSQWLDPGTIRPGASSHPYTWTLSGPGVLTFRFDHIMLPDSNTNLAGSQGFVSFWIDQRPEVPLETQILNSAAIYFDFNTPVMTNQTLHTVGIDYITSVKDFEKQNLPAIGVQPNPAATETLLTLPTGTERLILMDIMGRPVRFINTRAGVVRLERGDMPAGMYGLRAENRKGNVVGVGKVVWR